MNENHENDLDLQTALATTPMDGPSPDLMRRLRTAARETAPRKPWWRAQILPVSMATGAAALVVGAALTPAKASAKSFALIQAAAARVRAFQFSVLSNEDGKREAFSIVGVDGRVTMRGPEGMLMRFEPGALSFYDPDERKIMRLKLSGLPGTEDMAKEMGQGMAEGLKEMDLRKMLAEYRQKYGERGITISPVTREDGESVYHVTLAAPDEPERVEMTVDASTDLPERLRVTPGDGGQATVEMTMRFGSRVDESLLRADFPKGVPVEEMDLGKMMGDAMKGMEKAGAERP